MASTFEGYQNVWFCTRLHYSSDHGGIMSQPSPILRSSTDVITHEVPVSLATKEKC